MHRIAAVIDRRRETIRNATCFRGVPFAGRLMRGALWSLVGAALVRVARIPISIVLARWMGPTEFGEMGVVSSTIDLFVVFAGFGFGLTTTKYTAELRGKDPERAGGIIGLSFAATLIGGGVFTALLYALAPWLASDVLHNSNLVGPFRIGSVALFFAAFSGVQSGVLYGFEAYRVTAVVGAVIGVLDIPLMLGGYAVGGLEGVLWGMAGSRLVNIALLQVALRREARRYAVPIRLARWRTHLPVVWQFSVPAAIDGLLVIPVNWGCTAILVNQPNGYAHMGAYNAAAQWFHVVLFLPGVLGSALLPVFADRLGEGDSNSTAAILRAMLRVNAAVVVPAALVASVLSPLIMRLYGGEYVEAWPTLIALVWTAALLAMASPVGAVIAASGRMWVGLSMNLGWAAVFVSLSMLWASWGSLGVASARLTAYALHACWLAVFAWFVIARRTPAP